MRERISISLPRKTLRFVDEEARKNSSSRSAIIKEILNEAIERRLEKKNIINP